MGVIGYPIYPEVAREHLMMFTSFPNKPKVIESDFFRGSPVVEEAIKKAKKFWQAVSVGLACKRLQTFF